MKFGHLFDQHSYVTGRQAVSVDDRSIILVSPPSRKVSYFDTTDNVNVLLSVAVSTSKAACSISYRSKVYFVRSVISGFHETIKLF